MSDDVRVAVAAESDVLAARQEGRRLAAAAGFSGSDLTIIATAISEVARNIVHYATRGEILLRVAHLDGRSGIVVVARDEGPGIPDLEQALQDGYSTGGGLGLGLPGARRLMDELEVVTELGRGTTVTMRKWTA